MMDKRILKKIIINEVTGCWDWQGARTTCGYPVISRNGNTNIRGNRYVYEWVNGKIPDGHVVRHKCDNPLCLNPDHLELGTPADNVRDMDERGRRYKLLTKEVVSAILDLHVTGKYSKKQISEILNIDARRVGEVVSGKRDFDGRIIRR